MKKLFKVAHEVSVKLAAEESKESLKPKEGFLAATFSGENDAWSLIQSIEQAYMTPYGGWYDEFWENDEAQRLYYMEIEDLAQLLIDSGKDHLRQGAIGRIKRERELLDYANSVGWDREKVIEFALNGVSGWLGREVFETSFDDGSMREYAEAYDREGRLYGI